MKSSATSDAKSFQRSDEGEDWLTIQEASVVLGIAPSTLRRWADDGQVPVKRTLGGHRRFSRQALEQLAGAPAAGEARHIRDQLAAGWGIDRGELARQDWYSRLATGPAAGQMRGLGQRLLGLFLQFLARPSEHDRFLSEAHLVGSSYGRRARRAGLSLHDTLKACLYFRNSFLQVALPVPGLPQPRDAAQVANTHVRLNDFMDAILLGLVSGYDSQHD